MYKDTGTPLDMDRFKDLQTAMEKALGGTITEKHWNILRAAIHVFAEKGFSAGRTSEIAKEAGVSEGTVFNYFKTKHDLLQGLLLAFFTSVVRPFFLESIDTYLESVRESSLDEALTKLLLERMQLMHQNAELMKTVCAESMFHPELMKQIDEEIMPELMMSMKRIYDLEQERGTFRKDIDGLLAMNSLLTMTMGHMIMSKRFPQMIVGQSAEERISQIVDIFLNGVKANPESN